MELLEFTSNSTSVVEGLRRELHYDPMAKFALAKRAHFWRRSR